MGVLIPFFQVALHLPTRDPVQALANLNGTSGAAGGAVFVNFPQMARIFQLSADHTAGYKGFVGAEIWGRDQFFTM